MQKEKNMFKVPNGQDPYSAIGKYIRDHITAIEDIVAVIKINEVETNQLFTVDINEENYFIWKNDWWEGEEDVILIDFFPVSEAQRANQSVQSADTISRQAAIEALKEHRNLFCDNTPETFSGLPYSDKCRVDELDMAIATLINLPSTQPDIIRCKDCKYWTHIKRTNRYWCKTDDGLFDLNPSPDDFCSRAERRIDDSD